MIAREITNALRGKWHGSYGTARCPVHDDHRPSLSISDGLDGRVLVHCHAGCSQEAVWDALKGMGLVGQGRDRASLRREVSSRTPGAPAPPATGTKAKMVLAKRIWVESRSVAG